MVGNGKRRVQATSFIQPSVGCASSASLVFKAFEVPLESASHVHKQWPVWQVCSGLSWNPVLKVYLWY